MEKSLHSLSFQCTIQSSCDSLSCMDTTKKYAIEKSLNLADKKINLTFDLGYFKM